MAVTSFPNSFFQLTNYVNFNCVEPIPICLPIYEDADLYNWALFTDELTAPVNPLIQFYWRIVESCDVPIPEIIDSTFNPFFYKKKEVDDTKGVMTPREIKDVRDNPGFGVHKILCGKCFYIQVVKIRRESLDNLLILERTLIGCIGCFQKICDPCYTTVVDYNNNEDAFGFIYSSNVSPFPLGSLTNRIRLPFYLRQPQFPTSRNVFTLSNGQEIKLSARVKKEWSVKTEWMPKEWHEKLAIALEHDTVNFNNSNANVNSKVLMDSTYQIEWQDYLDYPMAQANFKVKQTPYNNVNSNCK